MNAQQKQFLQAAAAEAKKAAHIFPEMAACEAALESGHPNPVLKITIYGGSQLAREGNNLFGMKEHQHNTYGKMTLPTREFEKGAWVTVPGADWEKYPDWASCFADRMSTLQRLAPLRGFEHYKAALAAATAEAYVEAVSEGWSTDPGWQCSCGTAFIREADARAHAPRSPAHIVTLIPGLGRGLKVKAIFASAVGDWNATA